MNIRNSFKENSFFVVFMRIFCVLLVIPITQQQDCTFTSSSLDGTDEIDFNYN